MTTLKQNIEAEAAKAGTAIRAALQQFADATGMQAEVGTDWVSMRASQDAANSNHIVTVTIDVGGLSVRV